MRAIRLDGLEAMVCACAFIAATTLLLLLRIAVGVREMGMVGLGLGVGAVWVLRRFRPSRALPAEHGSHVVTPRSLGSLVLLGIGWFVLVIAAGFALLAGAMLSDPKFRDELQVVWLPVVPLFVGSALVYAGLRVGRGP
jgi:hypothetical protein